MSASSIIEQVIATIIAAVLISGFGLTTAFFVSRFRLKTHNLDTDTILNWLLALSVIGFLTPLPAAVAIVFLTADGDMPLAGRCAAVLMFSCITLFITIGVVREFAPWKKKA